MLRLMVLFGICFSFWEVGEPKVTMWEILKGSELVIGGATNVNDFHCDAEISVGEDKICETVLSFGKVSWSGIIRVSACDFDCANKIMTNDFQNTILADHYPFIIMEFIDLFEKDKMGSVLKGQAVVTLAGTARKIDISCRKEEMEDGTMKLTGSQTFLFTGFGLEPPRKFFGAIKVNNEVTVDFKILMKSQNTIPIPIR